MTDDTIRLNLLNEKLDLIFKKVCLEGSRLDKELMEQYFALSDIWLKLNRNEKQNTGQ